MGRIAKLLYTKIENFIIQTVEAHYGQNQICYQYGPSGDDAPPLPDDRVLLIPVEGTGNHVSAGTLVSSQGAKPGEKIIFSRDSEGNVKATIKLTNDGNLEIKTSGNTTIEASGDCLVKGKNVTVEGNVKVTGGTFEADGTASPTGSGCLCGLPYCAFSGAPQAGNISSGN